MPSILLDIFQSWVVLNILCKFPRLLTSNNNWFSLVRYLAFRQTTSKDIQLGCTDGLVPCEILYRKKGIVEYWRDSGSYCEMWEGQMAPWYCTLRGIAGNCWKIWCILNFGGTTQWFSWVIFLFGCILLFQNLHFPLHSGKWPWDPPMETYWSPKSASQNLAPNDMRTQWLRSIWIEWGPLMVGWWPL